MLPPHLSFYLPNQCLIGRLLLCSIVGYLFSFKYYNCISVSRSITFRQSLLTPHLCGMKLFVPPDFLSLHLTTSLLLPLLLGHQYPHVYIAMKSNVFHSVYRSKFCKPLQPGTTA